MATMQIFILLILATIVHIGIAPPVFTCKKEETEPFRTRLTFAGQNIFTEGLKGLPSVGTGDDATGLDWIRIRRPGRGYIQWDLYTEGGPDPPNKKRFKRVEPLGRTGTKDLLRSEMENRLNIAWRGGFHIAINKAGAVATLKEFQIKTEPFKLLAGERDPFFVFDAGLFPPLTLENLRVSSIIITGIKYSNSPGSGYVEDATSATSATSAKHEFSYEEFVKKMNEAFKENEEIIFHDIRKLTKKKTFYGKVDFKLSDTKEGKPPPAEWGYDRSILLGSIGGPGVKLYPPPSKVTAVCGAETGELVVTIVRSDDRTVTKTINPDTGIADRDSVVDMEDVKVPVEVKDTGFNPSGRMPYSYSGCYGATKDPPSEALFKFRVSLDPGFLPSFLDPTSVDIVNFELGKDQLEKIIKDRRFWLDGLVIGSFRGEDTHIYPAKYAKYSDIYDDDYQFEDLLADYEYVVAIEEAREERTIKRLQRALKRLQESVTK